MGKQLLRDVNVNVNNACKCQIQGDEGNGSRVGQQPWSCGEARREARALERLSGEGGTAGALLRRVPSNGMRVPSLVHSLNLCLDGDLHSSPIIVRACLGGVHERRGFPRETPRTGSIGLVHIVTFAFGRCSLSFGQKKQEMCMKRLRPVWRCWRERDQVRLTKSSAP